MNEVRKDDEQDMVDATNRELNKYRAAGQETTPNLEAHKGENGNITMGGGMKKGGATHRAHERADGCCERGHTKGTIVACKGGMYK